MAAGLPLPPDMATSRKIAARIEQALDSALQTIRFAHADIADLELQREASWAALRWSYRIQDRLAGIGECESSPVSAFSGQGGGKSAPDPSKRNLGQQDDAGNVLEGLVPAPEIAESLDRWPESTPTNGGTDLEAPALAKGTATDTPEQT